MALSVHNSHVVLIISDHAAFTRDLLARWQVERVVPGFTVMSTELFNAGSSGHFDVAVIGPAENERLNTILKNMETGSQPVICVAESSAQLQSIKAEYPRVLALQQHEQWVESLLLVAGECLKRVDLTARVRKAEQSLAMNERNAALGRYMLENRHTFNNLLTSVLGNSELLMMDIYDFPELNREQIETLHAMALHMHEIMQRFSSIAIEMQVAEKQSQVETRKLSHYTASTP